MRTSSPHPLLTTRELAAHLSVQPRTVRRWARARAIPHLRPTPKTLRFDLADVRAALAARGKAVAP